MFYMTYYVHLIDVFVISVITDSHDITNSTKANMLACMFYLDTHLFT